MRREKQAREQSGAEPEHADLVEQADAEHHPEHGPAELASSSQRLRDRHERDQPDEHIDAFIE